MWLVGFLSNGNQYNTHRCSHGNPKLLGVKSIYNGFAFVE